MVNVKEFILSHSGHTTLDVPVGYKIAGVGIIDEDLVIWILCGDSGGYIEKLNLRVVSSSTDVEGEYIGTVVGAYYFYALHVFKV